VVGLIAAIAIPSSWRARVARNESSAISDIREIISAEQTYAGTNYGFYDSLECLASPYECLPGYPAEAPALLSETIPPVIVKAGYERSFHAGPPAEPRELQRIGNTSPSSTVSFAYVAVPVSPGLSGIRGFCGDSSGMICVTVDGSPSEVVGGRCYSASCVPLQ
jgi:hypothetical protein